ASAARRSRRFSRASIPPATPIRTVVPDRPSLHRDLLRLGNALGADGAEHAAELDRERMRRGHAYTVRRQLVVAHCGQYRCTAALDDFHLVAVAQAELTE